MPILQYYKSAAICIFVWPFIIYISIQNRCVWCTSSDLRQIVRLQIDTYIPRQRFRNANDGWEEDTVSKQKQASIIHPGAAKNLYFSDRPRMFSRNECFTIFS